MGNNLDILYKNPSAFISLKSFSFCR